MSAVGEEIEFRNREEELDRLLGRVPPKSVRSTVTFIRAPTGYGKTRLVDQVLDRIDGRLVKCVYVEPEIRARHQTGRIYAWYFVQRAVAGITAAEGIDPSRTFATFLKRPTVKRIHWGSFYETAKEAFSISKLIKLGIEFGENLLGMNRYHPDALLKDDGKFATDLARDYLEWFAKSPQPILFVVRETQMMDLESFRLLLNLHKSALNVFFYFEYTAASEFLPEHQKILDEFRSANDDIRVVDLVKLNSKELLFLFRKYVRADIQPDSIELSRWSGNLRLVRELKDHVFLDRSYDSVAGSKPLTFDLRVLIHDNIKALANPEKLVLAGTVSHLEAIPITVMREMIGTIDASVDQAAFDRILVELVSGARYLRSDGTRLAISDEDVASVFAESPTFARFRALAEKGLRDIYLRVLEGDRKLSIPIQLAFRQAIALCIATGDAAAVQRLIRTMARGARASHDQGMYVGLIADALSRSFGAGTGSFEIQEWAAASAYEIGHYQAASELIQNMVQRDEFYDALLGFCHGETNRHDEALEIALALQSPRQKSTVRTLGGLIEVANLFALGRKSEAAEVHQRMRGDVEISTSSLFGYVLRFTELFVSFPDCTPDVLNSVEVFELHGMQASAAYSRLSGAMHLAYGGNIPAASQSVEAAKGYLEHEVRDLHVLYNNEAVVDLLSDRPSFEGILRKLENAAYGVRDDFYRAVIENNRLICRWKLGAIEGAKLSVQLLSETMDAPGFGNRDVFWTFTFNCWAFFNEIGERDAAHKMRERLNDLRVEQIDYDDYWRHRFGEAGRPDARYDHLLKFDYHPEYLSHWLVDLDAIRAARATQP